MLPKIAATPLRSDRPMTKYTRAQLASASGQTESVIERAIKRGLIPWAIGEGSQRHYTDDHLHRLLAIQALRRRGVRAAELGQRMREATDDEVRALAGVAVPTSAESPPPGPLPAPLRTHAELHRVLDAAVVAAADAIDVAPRRARLGIEAAIALMKREGLTVEEAAAAIDARSC
jgi:DNA-binding transcriptional MerR regulator